MNLPAKTFTPIKNRVVLKVPRVTETPSGLQLPQDGSPLRNAAVIAEAMKQDTPAALVVATGPECKQVKRGDTVLVLASTGAWSIRHNGEDLIMVEETMIVGVDDTIPNIEEQDKEKQKYDPSSKYGKNLPKGNKGVSADEFG